MDSSKSNPWSSGLCDFCSDTSSCCLTIFCPCITAGRITEIVSHGYLLLHAFTYLECFFTCQYRAMLRQHYSLEEKPCHDCLVHAFCGKCALCQEYRELEHRGFDMSIGWKNNVERQTRGVVAMAPVVEGGMKR
uniref:Cell number regulator 2-like n=1 Tax=Davidia involucrata TaxID=16924 RepID=A0A5B6YZN0_DAVIN